MFGVTVRGDFNRTQKFLKSLSKSDIYAGLDRLARKGADALSNATPADTGLTAASWGYTITRSKTSYTITWTNSNVVDGTPIVILIQYGHGTGTGGYVQGRDFINPVMRPIFDQIADEAWKVVKSA